MKQAFVFLPTLFSPLGDLGLFTNQQRILLFLNMEPFEFLSHASLWWWRNNQNVKPSFRGLKTFKTILWSGGCELVATLLGVASWYLTVFLKEAWNAAAWRIRVHEKPNIYNLRLSFCAHKRQLHLLNTYTRTEKFQSPPGAKIHFHTKQHITIQILYACSALTHRRTGLLSFCHRVTQDFAECSTWLNSHAGESVSHQSFHSLTRVKTKCRPHLRVSLSWLYCSQLHLCFGTFLLTNP